jgi:enediyne biosynthesis protein E7
MFPKGHETSAHALSFGLGLLALYPDVQAKMFQNIKEVIGDRIPEYSDYVNLDYVIAVFEEALRMYPPGFVIPKWVAEPTELGGYKIGSNMPLYIDARSLHMHPKYWDRPEEFRPERFLKGNREKMHSHQYLPFSDGILVTSIS